MFWLDIQHATLYQCISNMSQVLIMQLITAVCCLGIIVHNLTTTRGEKCSWCNLCIMHKNNILSLTSQWLCDTSVTCHWRIICMISAFGCPNPSPPDHGFIERNGTLAKISCYKSVDTSWEITCFQGMWQGEQGNCSARKLDLWYKYHGDPHQQQHVLLRQQVSCTC